MRLYSWISFSLFSYRTCLPILFRVISMFRMSVMSSTTSFLILANLPTLVIADSIQLICSGLKSGLTAMPRFLFPNFRKSRPVTWKSPGWFNIAWNASYFMHPATNSLFGRLIHARLHQPSEFLVLSGTNHCVCAIKLPVFLVFLIPHASLSRNEDFLLILSRHSFEDNSEPVWDHRQRSGCVCLWLDQGRS